MRIHIGMHDSGLTDKVISEKFPKGTMIRFLNEVESGPTLYLDARFKHPVDWISFYCQKCVETAYEVTGIPVPETLAEMKKKVDARISEGVVKAKRVPKMSAAPPKKTTTKKAATVKKPAKKAVARKTVTKKIAKGKGATATKKNS